MPKPPLHKVERDAGRYRRDGEPLQIQLILLKGLNETFPFPEILVYETGLWQKFTSDLPYKQPESTKSSGQRELQAQACENMLRTRSAISNNPGKGSHSLDFGRLDLRYEGKPLALNSDGCSGLIGQLFRATTLGSRLRVRRPPS